MPRESETEFDVIIVGAGPAGSAAAIYAGRLGLRTLLLDRSHFPRDKVCGDGLSGKAVTALRDLGLLDRVLELPGAAIHKVLFGSPSGVDLQVDLRRAGEGAHRAGFAVRRELLDHLLLLEAEGSVQACIQGFRVRDLVVENGQVCGIRGASDDGSATQEFRAHIVLGADGCHSIVARKAGLYRHTPTHRVVALRCYHSGVRDLTDQIEMYYLDEVVPGYFWVFPVGNGWANVGVGMVYEHVRRGKIDLRAALHRAVRSPRFRERFTEAVPLEEPVGWNLPVGSLHRKNHGNGFLLLGDAAGLIDPFTGEGIGNALVSAKVAADCARAACDAGDVSEPFLSRYDRELWSRLGHELRVSSRLQRIGRSRTLLNFVIARGNRSQRVRDTICGMVADTVPKRRLTNPLFYLKLLFM